MSGHAYLLFVGACALLAITPGPDMAYLLARCIAQGPKAGMMAVLGFNLGGLVHLTAAVTGLSAILLTSATAFTAVKWIGAAYLVWLGARALFTQAGPLNLDADLKPIRYRAVFWQGFWSDVLNPKVALFFLALLPQFVQPKGPAPVLQLLMLGLTVNAVCLPINMIIALASSRLTRALRRDARVGVWLNKIMGAVFVGLGLRLAAQKI